MDLETAHVGRASNVERSGDVSASLVGLSFVYCVASIAATSTSKMALVSMNCPLVLVGLGQLIATLSALFAAKLICLPFPAIALAELKRTLPLSVLYILCLFLALEGSRTAEFPVYCLLQWLALLFVVAGQLVVFSRCESLHVNAAVAMIQLGVLIAGIHYYSTLQYSGSAVVVLSEAAYAGYLLYVSHALGDEKGPFKLQYFVTLLGTCGTLFYTAATGDLLAMYQYPHWMEKSFILAFSLSSVFGAIATLATVALLRITSPVTFAVVDGVKNLVVTYVGIYLGSEFRFEIPLWRFYGIHVTVAGCLFYMYYRIHYSEPSEKDVEKVSDKPVVNV